MPAPRCDTLVALGAVPVINENDTVATAEIRFGDNDRLGARVASMMGADRLVLLSDVDGLYTANPSLDADRHAYPRSRRDHAGDRGDGGRFDLRLGPRRHGVETDRRARSPWARAAMRSSPRARRPIRWRRSRPARATPSSVPAPRRPRRASAGSPACCAPQGALVIDEGAVKALGEGRSLLPAGIRQIDGRFERGDAVVVQDRAGPRNRARAGGLQCRRMPSASPASARVEIEAILGYRGRDEMIHRDDLILTGSGA